MTKGWLLKQPQFTPMPVEEQVVSIFAGTRGYLDKIEIANIGRFEQSMLSEIKARAPEILKAIREQGELSRATEEQLKAFFDDFVKTFV